MRITTTILLCLFAFNVQAADYYVSTAAPSSTPAKAGDIGQVIPQKIIVLNAGGRMDTMSISNRINLKVDSAKTLNITQYNSASAPSGAGATAVTSLTSKGWTITHD